MHIVIQERQEFELLIERVGILVYRMDFDSVNAKMPR